MQLNPVYVAEDAGPGASITSVLAEDPDLSSSLRFSLDYSRSEARDENGRLVQQRLWQVERVASPSETQTGRSLG